MIKVRECVGNNVVSVGRGTPLRDIIRVFKEQKVQVIPVVEESGRLAGKISLDEITSVFQPQSAEINQLLETMPFIDTQPEAELDIEYITPEMGILVVADEIMSSHYLTVSPDDSIMKAYSIMRKNDTKILMVVDKEGRISGVIGLFDIIYALFQKKGIIK